MSIDRSLIIRLAVDLDQSLDQLLGVPVDAGSGPAGDGLLLETGTDYCLLETGDFILLE